MWCGSRPEAAASPSRLRPSAAPRTAALPLVGGGMAWGCGGLWAPAPPAGPLWGPPPPLRGYFGFGNVVGCASLLEGCAWASNSARCARFGGRKASPQYSSLLRCSWCGLLRSRPLVPRPFGPSGALAARALRLSCAPRFAAGARPSLWGSAGARLVSISSPSRPCRGIPAVIAAHWLRLARCARFWGRCAPPCVKLR